jgi:hypothetical protein
LTGARRQAAEVVKMLLLLLFDLPIAAEAA